MLTHIKDPVYEYIARVFYNVVLHIQVQMPRKNEFNINIYCIHISGLLIYLELKIKKVSLEFSRNL